MFTLFSGFAIANTIENKEKLQVIDEDSKKAAASYCAQSPANGIVNGYQTTFTATCCGTLPDGHTVSDIILLQHELQECADEKRDLILDILAN